MARHPRSRAERRSERSRIIAARLAFAREVQSSSGWYDDPSSDWYTGTGSWTTCPSRFASWNPGTCCARCQSDDPLPLPSRRWRGDLDAAGDPVFAGPPTPRSRHFSHLGGSGESGARAHDWHLVRQRPESGGAPLLARARDPRPFAALLAARRALASRMGPVPGERPLPPVAEARPAPFDWEAAWRMTHIRFRDAKRARLAASPDGRAIA
jgi:hypothetical protein